MTDAEWLSFVRGLINEPVERFWYDTELVLNKKIAISIVFQRFWNLLIPQKKKFDYLTVTGGNPEVPLPAGCFKIIKIEKVSTGRKLRIINENQLYKYDLSTSDRPLAVILTDDKLRFVPTPSSSSTTDYRVWYMARPTTLADLPEELHPLVAIEVAQMAKIKDEDASQELMVLESRLEDAANRAFAVAQLQDPEVWDEDTYEDGLEEQVA